MRARRSGRAGTPVRFMIVGIINTFAGLAVIYACKSALSVPDLAANLAGYVVGFAVSFLLNARWTFTFRGRLSSTLVRFVGTIVVGYCANLAVVAIALHHPRVNSFLAQAAGVIPYALIVYFGSKYYVFAQKRVESADAGELK